MRTTLESVVNVVNEDAPVLLLSGGGTIGCCSGEVADPARLEFLCDVG